MESCVKLCIENLRPFDIVEGQGFLHLAQNFINIDASLGKVKVADIVLTLGLFGKAQCPAALFSVLYVPCGPFPCFICTRRPFLFASLHPSVCLSVSRLKGFWMQACRKSRRVSKIVKKFTKCYMTISKNSVHNYRRN